MKTFTLTLTEKETRILRNALLIDTDSFYKELENAGENKRKAMIEERDECYELLLKVIEQIKRG